MVFITRVREIYKQEKKGGIGEEHSKAHHVKWRRESLQKRVVRGHRKDIHTTR